MAELVINNPDIYGVIAEAEGRIVGSNFLWEQDEIAGVGPITIAPDLQSNGVGRKLMQDVIKLYAMPALLLIAGELHEQVLIVLFVDTFRKDFPRYRLRKQMPQYRQEKEKI